jgi:predicted transcriptional regulator
MHTLVPIDQILLRAKRVGLAQHDLCKKADVAQSTVTRAVSRGDCTTRTLRKLLEALEAHEAELRQELNRLAPEGQGVAA